MPLFYYPIGTVGGSPQPEFDRLTRYKQQASKFRDLRSNPGVMRTRHPHTGSLTQLAEYPTFNRAVLGSSPRGAIQETFLTETNTVNNTEPELVSFPCNMMLPQAYIDTLIDMAESNNMTAEQLARNCVATFLRNYHPNGLTSTKN